MRNSFSLSLSSFAQLQSQLTGFNTLKFIFEKVNVAHSYEVL